MTLSGSRYKAVLHHHHHHHRAALASLGDSHHSLSPLAFLIFSPRLPPSPSPSPSQSQPDPHPPVAPAPACATSVPAAKGSSRRRTRICCSRRASSPPIGRPRIAGARGSHHPDPRSIGGGDGGGAEGVFRESQKATERQPSGVLCWGSREEEWSDCGS